jgi:hypothetical protein
LEHVHDIVRNANPFRGQWAWFPMGTWLEALAERGLAQHDRSTDRWFAAQQH